MVDKIRISIGSATVLGLNKSHLKVPPTNCYLMIYKSGLCSADCSFCPQARRSQSSSNKLSRVNWPVFSYENFLKKLNDVKSLGKFQRICIQTLKYPGNFKDLNEKSPEAHDVPWGTGVCNVKGMLEELHRQNFKGVFSIEYEYNWENSMPDIVKSIHFFNDVVASF